jgi:acyl-CoA thioester hydrolase
MSNKQNTPRRTDYMTYVRISTRWEDNDVYGHVNNVVYYSFFDTAVNQHLVEHQVLDINLSPVIGLVVETSCRYFSSITYPDRVVVGIKVRHIGSSSVTYDLAVFCNDNETASAAGHFVHVYVDRATNRPIPIPPATRHVLEQLIDSHSAGC